MPASCLVCGATKKSKVKLFHFAVITHKLLHLQEISKRRRHEWLRVLRKTEDDLKGSSGHYVCSKHFISGEPSKVQEVTDPDWIPSLNLTPITDSTVTEKRKPKKSRKLPEKAGPLAAKYIKTAANTSVGMDSEQNSEEESQDIPPANESEAKAAAELVTMLESMSNFKWMLQQKDIMIHSLQTKLRHHTMNESSFVDNDLKTHFYTGFATYKCFTDFVGVVSNFLPVCNYPGVSKMKVLIMVLVKLRLNFPISYMSLKFEIPFASLCEIFTSSVNNIADNLHISWPSERKVPKFLKSVFGNQLAAIVDILELQLDNGSLTYESVKFLIAYSPCGRTVFVSKPFPGICTDNWIVKESGFVNQLERNDLVLSLRGTLIENVVAPGGARNNIFLYVVARKRLSRLEWNDEFFIDMKNSLRALMDQLKILFGFLEHRQTEIWVASPSEFLSKVVKLTAALRNIILDF